MRKILFFIVFISSIFFNEYCHAQEQWLEKKSKHFIIYYQNESYAAYAKEVYSAAESYYKSIINTLGFQRFDFWLWDDRCEIFLYVEDGQYYNDSEQPVWSGAHVKIKERIIRSRVSGKFFVDSVLPHEMGHLIFREFVGYEKKLPLWIDEGIACLQENKYKEKRLSMARKLALSGMFIPVEELTRIKSNDDIILPNVFYSESASIINFLLVEFGKEDFLKFCRRIRDGEDWQDALRKVYNFETLNEINDNWINFLKR